MISMAVPVSANLPGNADYTSTAATFAVSSVAGATADISVSAVNDRLVEAITESFAGQALSAPLGQYRASPAQDRRCAEIGRAR